MRTEKTALLLDALDRWVTGLDAAVSAAIPEARGSEIRGGANAPGRQVARTVETRYAE